MKEKELSLEQKKLDNDLMIIMVITFGIFLVYTAIGNQLMEYVKNSDNPLIFRLFINAGVQFGIAGLGVTIVSILRREKFSNFGLRKRNTIKSVFGSIACFIPYICYVFISGKYEGYKPFSILISNDVLRSAFPINILGMALIVLIWGFFEGFNYAVISDKLNKRYPSKNKWINVGAIICALVCVLFHPFNTSFWGIIEIITTLIAIYGMLVIKTNMNNAWGCIFVFCFIWNAF